MNKSLINKNVERGVFKKYFDGNYLFLMDNGESIVFENISQEVLKKYNLKTDTYVGKSFEINYSEYLADDDEDFVSFKIEKLELA